MKKLLLAVLMAGLVLGLTAIAEPSPKVGSVAPELELPSISGQSVSLQSPRGEKKVILAFFTSWSKSCQAELDALADLYGKNRGALEVLAVSFDKKSKDLKNYLAKADLPFPVLVDKKLSTLDTFQILIIPTTFCINEDGVIEKVFVDFDDNVEKAVEAWLGS
jgi:peroxiredoxin